MPTGKVKYLNKTRGFGFIEPEDGGQAVFFHVTSLWEDVETMLGARVGYDLAPSTAYTAKIDPDKQMMAVRVRHV